MRVSRSAAAATIVCAALLLAACGGGDDTSTDVGPSEGGVVSNSEGGTPTGSGAPVIGATVKIGLINQENSPILSAPEVREAAEATVEWLNANRDGIGGKPIELVTCVQSSAEELQKCAQDMAADPEIVSVINGVNVFTSFMDFYGTLGDKPVVGGVPLFPADFTSPDARYFFGGTLSAFTGIGLFAAEHLEARTIGVLYGDNAAGAAAKTALQQIFGPMQVEATYVPVPSPSTDVSPQVTQVSSGFDAIIVVTAAAECAPVMQAVDALGIAKETVVYTGTCGDDDVMSAAGSQALGSWMHFTLWGRDLTNSPESAQAEFDIADEIYETYAPETPRGGLSILGVNSLMNIHALYTELGLDHLSKDEIFAAMDSGEPRPSFMGTPWVCGTNPTFPSVCNADNFFGVITEGFQYEVVGPVDALAKIAEAAAGNG